MYLKYTYTDQFNFSELHKHKNLHFKYLIYKKT